jgi:uncharacterized protein
MLSFEERKYAIELAKESLRTYLENKKTIQVDKKFLEKGFGQHTELLLPRGCFVTLTFKDQLRGCIGTIESGEPLYLNIIQNAIRAGTQDPRFPALTIDQYDSLEFEISVMGPVSPLSSLDKIEIGRDGLIVKNGAHQGLLLPQVPVEWNWGLKEFLENTCQKAGLDKNAYKEDETELYYFSAEAFSF